MRKRMREGEAREDEKKKFWQRHLQEVKDEIHKAKVRLHRDMKYWKSELRECERALKDLEKKNEEARENGK